jgi:NADH-quinone oxidoreductase subunit N
MNAIIISALLGIVMMFSGIWIKRETTIRYMAIIGFLLLLVVNMLEYKGVDLFHINTRGMLEVRPFDLVFNVVITFCCLVYMLLSAADIGKLSKDQSDFFALIFFIFSGIYIVVSYISLLMLFLGIEIISIPLYILAAGDKNSLKSNEAGLKYFLMGAFFTGIMLLGIAFLYGAMGSFNIRQMDPVLQQTPTALIAKTWAQPGMLLILASMAFKVSAAPFHFWTPDVYDGSPTVFTSFMATIVKAALFIAFMRLFHQLFGTLYVNWKPVMAAIIALTLVFGNITAVFQQSVKRMLAYSSIAQAGFMLFAVMVLHEKAYQAILLYTAAYCLATTGIFAILLRMKDFTFDGFNGLARKDPLLAGTAAVFLLSLAGIPLTAGFFAKYYMLSAAIYKGVYMWLIILAVICAAISVYYYFRVIQAMYFKSGQPEMLPVSRSLRYTLIFTAALVLLLGVLPNLVTAWA